MKSFYRILPVCLCIVFMLNQPSHAQINPLRKIKQKTNEKINKEIDKAFDKSSEKDKKDKKTENDKKDIENHGENASRTDPPGQQSGNAGEDDNPSLNWSKYDFVPGDFILFEDNLSGEENGEFPSRWDLKQGNVEIAEFGGENVIMFRGGNPMIIPYINNSRSDYLPDAFTFEFDLWLPSNVFSIYFYDRKNQKAPSGHSDLEIWDTYMEMSPARSNIPDNGSIKNSWVHVSIACTNGKLKGYINETRLINIPRLAFNPTGLTLNAYHASDNSRFYIKNIRLAKGGVKYYERFLQDGKIISNAIRFETGKATLRPESMGAINEIFLLLKDHPEVKFSIEGHTDSDGEQDFNMLLSEKRAETVKNRLVSMGINTERLQSRGFGESKPVSDNRTPEGRAANRRVEFVKIDQNN